MRKPVFGVSDQVRHKPACTIIEDSQRLGIYGFRKKSDCTIHEAKTKALISCAVIAQLICVFVFANAKENGFTYRGPYARCILAGKGDNSILL